MPRSATAHADATSLPTPGPRIKRDPDGRRPIRLRTRCQNRSNPFLVLDGARQAYIVMQPPRGLYRAIVHCFAARNEILIHLCISISELEVTSGTEPVGGPSLNSHTVSSYPASYDVRFVC